MQNIQRTFLLLWNLTSNLGKSSVFLCKFVFYVENMFYFSENLVFLLSARNIFLMKYFGVFRLVRCLKQLTLTIWASQSSLHRMIMLSKYDLFSIHFYLDFNWHEIWGLRKALKLLGYTGYPLFILETKLLLRGTLDAIAVRCHYDDLIIIQDFERSR